MRLKFGRLLFVVVLLACLPKIAWCDDPVRRTEDVIYGRKCGMALTMDVFQPATSNGCGLLFLVNGGWLSSKATPLMVTIRPEDYRLYLSRGYTVFAVVTSSQPKFDISEQMRDVQRAVRFVRSSPRSTVCVPIGWEFSVPARADIWPCRSPRKVAREGLTPRIRSNAKRASFRRPRASFRRPIS